MNGRIEVLADPPALARHVAEWMTAAALAAKDTFRVSLSGGSTPKALFALLASADFVGRALRPTPQRSFFTFVIRTDSAWSRMLARSPDGFWWRSSAFASSILSRSARLAVNCTW